jgi:hypothetical protein
MSFFHTAHRVAEESMPLATACLLVWLATGLYGGLDAYLCLLYGWLDAYLCVSYRAGWMSVCVSYLAGWMSVCVSTCSSVCQLTGNLLSPRIAKRFAHAHRTELHKSRSYTVHCQKTKTAEYKEDVGEGKSKNKKRREELLLSFARNE